MSKFFSKFINKALGYKPVHCLPLRFIDRAGTTTALYQVVLLENKKGKRKVETYGCNRRPNTCPSDTAENHSQYIYYIVPWLNHLLTTDDIIYERSYD